MTVPDSTRSGLRRLAVSGLVPAAACAVLLTGCGSTVPGHPMGTGQQAGTRRIPAELATLLLEPEQFPANYPALVLPPEAAAQAAGDLNGIARGATVDPSECAPPIQQYGPNRTAVVVGTDNDSRSTITVELTRTGKPLSALRSQLQQCEQVRVSRAGATSTVTTRLQSAPPVDADDTLALRRTVAPQVSGAGLIQSMQTLTGQIGDVRITVTYMSFSDADADMAALDALFTTAVLKVSGS